MKRVAVFGGGMGGLCAAHELVERGFEVDIYEQRLLWGGKARSYGVDQTGRGGREDLPAEHGFRFFPGFYQHVPDTMSRIPYSYKDEAGRQVTTNVKNNLVQCLVGEFLQIGEKTTIFPVRWPRSRQEFRDRVRDLKNHGHLGLTWTELLYFMSRLFRVAIACQERRLEEYEKTPWWQFVGAEQRSTAYQNILAKGMTRSLVAMRAEVASTRTVGDILLQMVYYTLTPGASSDRVLNGPTSKVWIDPWRAYLTSRGVRFHDDRQLARLELGSDGRIARATLKASDHSTHIVEADHYFAAVPVEVMAPLVVGPIAAAAPSLGGLGKLEVEWMNGVQFYLARDYPMVFGHSLYTDSNWAVTSISQPQFWRQGQFPIETFGDGNVKGLLSVDISDWTDLGQFTTKEAAQYCTREQIVDEAWAQVQAHLKDSGHGALLDEDRLHSHLDHDIECPRPGDSDDRRTQLAGRRGRSPVHALINRQDPGPSEAIRKKDIDLEPLLVNTIDSWQYRPEAGTEIPNLFLAADYVRTNTDLATMEGANEAGRRAVNALLDTIGSSAPRCQIWPLKEPIVLAPFRAVDWLLYQFQKR